MRRIPGTGGWFVNKWRMIVLRFRGLAALALFHRLAHSDGNIGGGSGKRAAELWA
jgi:hypothetical protein